MKTEVLKKHHYWIVAGVSLLMVLLAFFMLSSVSEAIDAQQNEIKKAAEAVRNVPAPGKVAIAALEEQKKVLDKKKDELWEKNWENQKRFFTWPKSPDNAFLKFNDLKFGEKFTFTDEMSPVFQTAEVYRKMYEEMAASVTPTKFNNGWQTVLAERYIEKWGDKKPEPRQLWLAMEDVWVLRAMLDPIRTINLSASVFEPVDPTPNNKLKRTFRSRIWQIELEVVDQPPTNKIIKAKLKNLTNQMQLLGSGSALTLKVWIDENPDSPPIEFKIEGEFVPGDSYCNATRDNPAPYIPSLPSHIIPPGVTVTELAKVEQVLDDRTVPIRQIENVSLSWPSAKVMADMKAMDMVDFKNKLQPPDFWKEGTDAPKDASGGTTTTTPTPTPTAAVGEGRGSGRKGARGGPIPLGGSTGGSVPNSTYNPASPGTSTLVDAVDNNRKRYLEVTGQLRRMPVAIKLVLDLRYMQDVMVAYANSPLRFQIVQYHWARYRGTLMPSADPAGGSGGVAGGFGGDTPAINGSIGADLRGVTARGLPLETGARQGYIPGLSGGSLTSVSDAQANSALIELTLYGIVTLYEKHEVPKDAKKDTATPATTPGATTPGTSPIPSDLPPRRPRPGTGPVEGTPAPKTPTPAAPEKTPAETPPAAKGPSPVTPPPTPPDPK